MAEPVALCNYPYDRPQVLGGERLLCQYLADHPKDTHSHHTVQVADEAELEIRAQAERLAAAVDSVKSTPYGDLNDAQLVPMDVTMVVKSLEDGDYDDYLELILAAAHDRKRAKRGTRGFPRRRG